MSSNKPAADSHDLIRVQGARQNNLKDISVELPKRRLTVFTGVSGSGKSSLVFGTIAAGIVRIADHDAAGIVRSMIHHAGAGKPPRSLGCDRPLRGASPFGAGKLLIGSALWTPGFSLRSILGSALRHPSARRYLQSATSLGPITQRSPRIVVNHDVVVIGRCNARIYNTLR
jgi:energy-coupling factor transporter ATP-binding protein EcfA2